MTLAGDNILLKTAGRPPDERLCLQHHHERDEPGQTPTRTPEVNVTEILGTASELPSEPVVPGLAR